MTVTSYALLQRLYEAARAVLDGKSIPESMRVPLEGLEQMVTLRESVVGQRVVELAQATYAADPCDIDIDRDTIVYHNEEDGYWVMGWCYVFDSEVEDGTAGELEGDAANAFVAVSPLS